MQRANVVQSNSSRKVGDSSQSSSHSMQFVLPSGWKRDESIKPAGLTSGKTEVCYISPDGLKCRSRHELQKALGDKYDLSSLDFRNGRLIHHPYSKSLKKTSEGTSTYSKHSSSKLESRLNLPTRQTVHSSIQHPVTVVRNHPASKRTEVKHGNQDPPRQLFWEKRLQGYRSTDPETGESTQLTALPKALQSAGAPGYQPEQLVQSVVNCFLTRNCPITGQAQSRSAFEKNAGIAIDCDQPLIKQTMITEDDIRRQEERVKEARRKLDRALSAFGFSHSEARIRERGARPAEAVRKQVVM